MRLKKGFGTVRKLTGNRRNPYAVHPPKVNGIRPKAICYVNDYHIGVCVLNAWHNGKYYAGMELDLKERKPDEVECSGSSTFQEVYELFWENRFGECAAKELGKSSQAGMRSAWKRLKEFQSRHMDEVTIMELQGVVNETAKEFSKSTVTRLIGLIKGMYRFAVPRELCRKDIGAYIETPKVKEEVHHDSFTDEEIEKLWSAAAHPTDVPHNHANEASQTTARPTGEKVAAHPTDENRETAVARPTGEKDATDAKENGSGKSVPDSVDVCATVRMILTMIYSGFRIGAWQAKGEYGGMSVDLEKRMFTGGVKTAAGKNRVVPMHSAIVPLVEGMRRSAAEDNTGKDRNAGGLDGLDSAKGKTGTGVPDQLDGAECPETFIFLCGKGQSQFRRDMKTVLKRLGIRPLTPHSCRHTFHRLLERAGVNEADRKRLMGHSLKGDVTNGVYGHRSVTELSREVEKIEAPVSGMDMSAAA